MGVIGPKKVFNGLYPILAWCFLIGFLLAFPCIAFKKWASRKYSKYFEPSIIIGGFLGYAPYNLSYNTGVFMLVMHLCIMSKESMKLGGRSMIIS